MSSSFAVDFAKETWTLYGIGIGIIVLRFIARIRRNGIKNLRADDHVMIQGTFWYTLLCVSLNRVASGGGSNLMTDDDIAALTPEITADRIAGSKWVLVSEEAMLLTVWSMKVCMLLIYGRMTRATAQEKFVRWIAIWLVLGFIGSQLSLFLTCRPFAQYWAVPTSNQQCATYQHYEIIQACFHITGDVAMLMLGVPIIISTQLPLRQKVILTGVFGMGVFVVVAAILVKLYCLVPSLISYVYMNWYFREASVSVYVTNLPFLWSLLHELCPSLRSWARSSGKHTNTNKYIGGMSFGGKSIPLSAASGGIYGDDRTTTVVITTKTAREIEEQETTAHYPYPAANSRRGHKVNISKSSASQNHILAPSESQERIRESGSENAPSHSRQSSDAESLKSNSNSPWTIRQDVTFTVESSQAHPDTSSHLSTANQKELGTTTTVRPLSPARPSLDGW